MQTIEERIKPIIADQFAIKADDIRNEHNLWHDLGADSLDMVELLMCVEDEFRLDIPDEEAEKIATVQQAIDYVTDYIKV